MNYLNDSEDRNEPFDSIDAILTKAMGVLPWVAVGMAITAALILGAKHFTN